MEPQQQLWTKTSKNVNFFLKKEEGSSFYIRDYVAKYQNWGVENSPKFKKFDFFKTSIFKIFSKLTFQL